MPNAADGIILVVEAEKVRPVVVSRAKQSIEEHGGQVLGVVLNKARRYIPQFIYRFM
jgi:Mrp family chromosome partitioning ATPase